MDWDIALRWGHVLGACVLIGTGAGIAFFMAMAHRTRDASFIAQTASIVVIADTLFTATAVIVQPVTGVLLALSVGWALTETWIVISVLLYVLIGLCWLPVVWIQLQMRNLARETAASGTELPTRYYQLFKIWFALGIPAFISILIIIWLMIARPSFGG